MLRQNFFRAVVAAALLAAVDAVATRMGHPHRPMGPGLFLQGWLLWLVPTLPAACALGLAARFLGFLHTAAPEGTSERGPLRLSAIAVAAAAPILLHAALNAYTSIGGDVSGLKSPEPWLIGFGLIAGAVVAALVVESVLRRVRSRTRAIAAVATAVVACYLPAGGLDQPERPALTQDQAPNLLLLVWDTARAGSFSFLGAERATTPELERLTEKALVFDNARSVTHFTFTSHLSDAHGALPHRTRRTSARYATPARERAERHWPRNCSAPAIERAHSSGPGCCARRRGWTLASTCTPTRWTRREPPPTCGPWFTTSNLSSSRRRAQAGTTASPTGSRTSNGRRTACSTKPNVSSKPTTSGRGSASSTCSTFTGRTPPSDAARDRFATDYDGIVGGYASRANDFPDGYEMKLQDDAHLLSLYESEFFDLDQLVGAFVDSLDLDGSNTAVLVTADHGEAFGEGGQYEHEDILEPQVSVPMVLRLPGSQPRSGRSDLLVSGIDVAPTLRSLAGLGPREDQALGVDLSSARLPPNRVIYVEDRDHHDAEKAQFAAYTEQFKLVWLDALHDDSFELFDLANDPIGLTDVSDQHPETFEQLKQRLVGDRSWLPLDRVEGREGGIDADALRALGYLGDD